MKKASMWIHLSYIIFNFIQLQLCLIHFWAQHTTFSLLLLLFYLNKVRGTIFKLKSVEFFFSFLCTVYSKATKGLHQTPPQHRKGASYCILYTGWHHILTTTVFSILLCTICALWIGGSITLNFVGLTSDHSLHVNGLSHGKDGSHHI